MSSQFLNGVTTSCSSVPRSLSRTMAMEVIIIMVIASTMARMPGTM